MFTLTISDKPIVVTNANEDEVRNVLMSEDFKQDLKVLESEGEPLWDGVAALSVRPASEQEVVAFQSADEEEDSAGAEDDEPLILFLVDINDPEHPDDV